MTVVAKDRRAAFGNDAVVGGDEGVRATYRISVRLGWMRMCPDVAGDVGTMAARPSTQIAPRHTVAKLGMIEMITMTH